MSLLSRALDSRNARLRTRIAEAKAETARTEHVWWLTLNAVGYDPTQPYGFGMGQRPASQAESDSAFAAMHKARRAEALLLRKMERPGWLRATARPTH